MVMNSLSVAVREEKGKSQQLEVAPDGMVRFESVDFHVSFPLLAESGTFREKRRGRGREGGIREGGRDLLSSHIL